MLILIGTLARVQSLARTLTSKRSVSSLVAYALIDDIHFHQSCNENTVLGPLRRGPRRKETHNRSVGQFVSPSNRRFSRVTRARGKTESTGSGLITCHMPRRRVRNSLTLYTVVDLSSSSSSSLYTRDACAMTQLRRRFLLLRALSSPEISEQFFSVGGGGGGAVVGSLSHFSR